MKTALITGITGQDGSYLAEFLLEKGYEVHGIVRRASSANTARIDHLIDGGNIHLHCGDLEDGIELVRVVGNVGPDEVYNLGAQSHVKVSFDIPTYTGSASGLGATRMLEAIKSVGGGIRYYQASSSEMYGGLWGGGCINEDSPFHPRSPYACAKVYAYWITVNYREAYGVHASNGILFNHESPRRGETFVTRKITKGVADIVAGKKDRLLLGNVNAMRDWGHAKDYVEAMWLMLQRDEPGDYVIATREAHSVREFADLAFSRAGLDWEKFVRIDQSFMRPSEVDVLIGDYSKAELMLGWRPRTTFNKLVEEMVDSDMAHCGQ